MHRGERRDAPGSQRIRRDHHEIDVTAVRFEVAGRE
jgi:hypothetical protein